jgi:hypothetical protein
MRLEIVPALENYSLRMKLEKRSLSRKLQVSPQLDRLIVICRHAVDHMGKSFFPDVAVNGFKLELAWPGVWVFLRSR